MLALIPARGGSKGVPGKNIKLLGGSPLIKWTIDEAKRSKYIDKIIVSTDDKDIANLCIELGVGVPFMRPKELAQDDSYAIDTYLYVMKKMLDDNVYCSDDFIVLLPTVPFRNYFDIDKSIELYYENEAESVISAVQAPYPVTWNFLLEKNNSRIVKNNCHISEVMNRQSASYYRPNGGVYVFRYSFLANSYSYYGNRTYAYIMPEERSVDIDTNMDFMFAEFMIEKLKSSS